MTRVLFVGQQPETVDFADPILPPGMNAERINAGIALALKQMAERGWHADLCPLRPDETAGPDVERSLKAQTYDCVVIGAAYRRAGPDLFRARGLRPGTFCVRLSTNQSHNRPHITLPGCQAPLNV